MVTSEENVSTAEEILKNNNFSGIPVLKGGKERYDSAEAGISYFAGKKEITEVLIHDAARPLITEEEIRSVIADTKKFGAAVLGHPAADTIKISDSDGRIQSTPDRKYLWVVETPQGFSLPIIQKAFEKFREANDGFLPTDDASLVEKYTDTKVALTLGGYRNRKVTTRDDLDFLRWTMQK